MLTIETEQEDDGRWIAEIAAFPGVMAYGQSRQEAIDRVQALSLRVIAERQMEKLKPDFPLNHAHF